MQMRLGQVERATTAPRPEPSAADAAPYVWRNVVVGAGGFLPNLIFSPEVRGLAYARSDMGGLYRYDARATAWQALQDHEARSSFHGVESLALDPSDPDRVYAAVGMYRGEPAAILCSEDRGASWAVRPTPFRMGANEEGRGLGERLAVDPNLPTRLLFGSRDQGLFVSDDRGVVWRRMQGFPHVGRGPAPAGAPANGGLSFVVFDPDSGGCPTRTILVGVADPGVRGLYRSDDAGRSWRCEAGGPAKDLLPMRAALGSGGWLYVTYSDGAGPNGVTRGAVYRYHLSSGAWEDVTPERGRGVHEGGYMAVALDPRRPGVVMVSTLNRWTPGDTIWRSTDHGRTWRSLSQGAKMDVASTPFLRWGGEKARFGWWIAGLAIDPFDSARAVFTTGATIFETDDLLSFDAGGATSWRPWVSGIEQSAAWRLAARPTEPRLLTGFADIGGFAHEAFDHSPSKMFDNPVLDHTVSLGFAALEPDRIVRAGYCINDPTPRFAVSVDGGRNWRALDPLRDRGPSADFGLEISADGRALLVTGHWPRVSVDMGETWSDVEGLAASARAFPDALDSACFYAVDFDRQRLLVSRDRGATFGQARAAGLRLSAEDRPAGHDWPLSATCAAGRSGDLWFCLAAGLYRSRDFGETFEAVPTALGVRQISFGAAAPGRDFPTLYAIGQRAGETGVWRSVDEGRTWMKINGPDQQYGQRFRCLAADPSQFGRVYVGTDGRGVFFAEHAGAGVSSLGAAV